MKGGAIAIWAIACWLMVSSNSNIINKLIWSWNKKQLILTSHEVSQTTEQENHLTVRDNCQKNLKKEKKHKDKRLSCNVHKILIL